MGPEKKLWHELKKVTPEIKWTRMSLKETTCKTFSGSRILDLVASGYRLETSCLGLEACGLLLLACGL